MRLRWSVGGWCRTSRRPTHERLRLEGNTCSISSLSWCIMDVDTGSCQEAGMDGAVGSLSTSELGCLIVARRAAIDSAEARWLLLLAEFDRRSGWAYDGAYDCAAWLVQRCGLGRSTAKERLRVAYELQRRPVLAAAFEAGEVSFSKVRILTRIVD